MITTRYKAKEIWWKKYKWIIIDNALSKNLHNLRLLQLGVKAKEIRWKKSESKINKNWQCFILKIYSLQDYYYYLV